MSREATAMAASSPIIKGDKLIWCVNDAEGIGCWLVCDMNRMSIQVCLP